MGGPPPEWEGIDKVVRGVFPGDHQRKFPVGMAQPSLNFRLSARRTAVHCAEVDAVLSACRRRLRYLYCFVIVDAQYFILFS